MIKIIRAKERHISAIGKLWLEFIRFHQDIDPIFTPRDGALPGFVEHHLRRFIKSKDGLVLVALEGEQAVGFSLSEIKGPMEGYHLDRFGYVDTLAVMASYRRRGIGEKMFDEIMKWFHSKNIDRVELEITTRNHLASSFWAKHGFTDYMRKLYRQI
jgi:ribosomal protein S18 acetylase RimI-like enzyme